MRKTLAIVAILNGILLMAGAAWAQDAPRPKSQKELDGLKAIDAAPSVDAKLQKIDDFLAAFADSQYKLLLLDQAVGMAADKNDYPLAMAWGQRDLDVNPNSFVAMQALANVTANNTKEFDLDKDKKLEQAEKWANSALEALKTAPRPFQYPEDKWPDIRKFFIASCYQALGLVAMDRKKFDVAVTQFQAAFDTLPEPAYELRVGEANLKGGKFDNAIAAYDKVLAIPDLNPTIKGIADRQKADALRRKGVPAAVPAPAAPPPPQTAPPPAPAK